MEREPRISAWHWLFVSINLAWQALWWLLDVSDIYSRPDLFLYGGFLFIALAVGLVIQSRRGVDFMRRKLGKAEDDRDGSLARQRDLEHARDELATERNILLTERDERAENKTSALDRKISDLTGLAEHARKMLRELDEKKQTLGDDFEGHMNTVMVNGGNIVQRARRLGTLDDNSDLLIILDGVENLTHPWRGPNLAIDRFKAFWYWLQSDAPEFTKRGDFRPYTLKKLAEIIEDEIKRIRQT